MDNMNTGTGGGINWKTVAIETGKALLAFGAGWGAKSLVKKKSKSGSKKKKKGSKKKKSGTATTKKTETKVEEKKSA